MLQKHLQDTVECCGYELGRCKSKYFFLSLLLSFFLSPPPPPPWSQRDPFGTGSSLSETERSSIQNQSIPSLAQFLEVAAGSGRLVLFDLRRPPYGHPYNMSFINTTLQVVRDHINSSQVSPCSDTSDRFAICWFLNVGCESDFFGPMEHC